MNTKTCSRCKIDKPISEFFKIKDRVDQYSAWCRECLRFNSKRYYDSPQGQQHFKNYSHSEQRKKTLMRYNVSDKHKTVTQRYYATGAPKEYTERRKRTDPNYKKIRNARSVALIAKNKGNLIAQPCEYIALGNCHGRIEMHHDDYNKPLNVRWLCSRHHKFVDGKSLP